MTLPTYSALTTCLHFEVFAYAFSMRHDDFCGNYGKERVIYACISALKLRFEFAFLDNDRRDNAVTAQGTSKGQMQGQLTGPGRYSINPMDEKTPLESANFFYV